jgi:Virulence factor
MAFYQILYWQDIPAQVKAWDDFDEIKVELNPQFMIKIDQAARAQGLTDEDGYLSQWKWAEIMERSGTADEVIEIVKKEVEEQLK